MLRKEKKNQEIVVIKPNEDNKCPVKEGDNCLVPGIYSDSEPIGGG